jgi:hypothetical protein
MLYDIYVYYGLDHIINKSSNFKTVDDIIKFVEKNEKFIKKQIKSKKDIIREGDFIKGKPINFYHNNSQDLEFNNCILFNDDFDSEDNENI